jgi:hypothetical protein
MKRGFALTLAGLLLVPLALVAHHSFDAEFDRTKRVNLTGPVKKVEWTNPHIWIHMDAKDTAGKVTLWQCEMGSPNTLTRQGWKRDDLKPGDEIVIDGSRAKDGTNTCNATSVRLASGRRMFAGTSDTQAPQQ